MNRNTLLIVIAAVAVVVVVAGILLLGNEQPRGSLSGALGTTTLTLNITACTEPDGPPSTGGALNFTLSGYLRDANGGPVPGRTVLFARIRTAEGSNIAEPAGESGSAVTAADGSFSLLKQEPPTVGYGASAHDEFRAAFAGDAQYTGSDSNVVSKLC